jgi:hypothetical protein
VITVRDSTNKSDGSVLGITVGIELFQNSYYVATFILGMRNVYLGGFPAAAHGDESDEVNSDPVKPPEPVDQCGSERKIRPRPIVRTVRTRRIVEVEVACGIKTIRM